MGPTRPEFSTGRTRSDPGGRQDETNPTARAGPPPRAHVRPKSEPANRLFAGTSPRRAPRPRSFPRQRSGPRRSIAERSRFVRDSGGPADLGLRWRGQRGRSWRTMERRGLTPALGPALAGEFFGTTLLIVLGQGVVAADVLLNPASDKMMVTTAWGLAVALAVYPLREAERRPRQPGGDPGPGRPGRVPPPLASAPLLARPARRRLPRRRAHLRGLCRGVPLVRARPGDRPGARWKRGQARWARGPAGPGSSPPTPCSTRPGGTSSASSSAPMVLLLGVRALTDRRNAGPGGYLEPLALGGPGLGHRPVAGRPDRLRHQPRPRPRAPDRLRPARLGPVRLPVARLLLLGPHPRPPGRRPRRHRPLRPGHPPPPAPRGRAQPARDPGPLSLDPPTA